MSGRKGQLPRKEGVNCIPIDAEPEKGSESPETQTTVEHGAMGLSENVREGQSSPSASASGGSRLKSLEKKPGDPEDGERVED